VPPRRRAALISVGIVAIALIFCGMWLGARVLIVKSELQAAQPLLTKLQAEATGFQLKNLQATTEKLDAHTSMAATQTRDPIWRAAEVIPFIGDNLYAVRAASETLDEVVSKVALPGAKVASAVNLTARDPKTGALDLSPLPKAAKILVTAKTVIGDAQERMARVQTSRTIGQISAVVTQLDRVLSKASVGVADGTKIVTATSGVLGQDGARKYLLMFQNNAESTALGGSSASYTQLTVDKGAVKITGQASSANFVQGEPVDVKVDQSAIDLYGAYLINHTNTATSRPDFPTAAEITRAYWLRDKKEDVDGVISIDPLALAQVLKATGPITLPTGEVLTSGNVVKVVVNEIYFRIDAYKHPQLSDAFFEGVASAVFAKVVGGQFDLKTMVGSITAGVNNGSIMMWSAHPKEEAALAGTRLEGVLPKNNKEQTVLGVYYRDTSASKIDYYMKTSTVTTTNVCTNSKNPTFSTTVSLHLDLTTAQANALPAYVKSFPYGAKMFVTQVFVYGPVGGSIADYRVDSVGIRSEKTLNTDDLGRPVASFSVVLAPGQTSAVTATFTGKPGDYGPIEVRGTPMINATTNTITPMSCG
jgi:hypothetical protein